MAHEELVFPCQHVERVSQGAMWSSLKVGSTSSRFRHKTVILLRLEYGRVNGLESNFFETSNFQQKCLKLQIEKRQKRADFIKYDQ